jgi:hypothetical protein
MIGDIGKVLYWIVCTFIAILVLVMVGNAAAMIFGIIAWPLIAMRDWWASREDRRTVRLFHKALRKPGPLGRFLNWWWWLGTDAHIIERMRVSDSISECDRDAH